ncbi:MAG: alpha-galactosidase [Bacteroidales bacterium]|nr:alpha-galactosidase [Bacteroidales bacterium]
MRKVFLTLLAILTMAYVHAAEKKVIRISTDNTDLVLQVADNGRLYQVYYGDKLLHEADLQNFDWYVHAGSDGSISRRGWEVYAGSGNEDYFEPAVAITHNDGNMSTMLKYVSSEQKAVDGGTETTIRLSDDQYPVDVTLHYIAYAKENVIKAWSEIKHNEKKAVTIWRYASTMLYFNAQSYFLTEYHGDWAKEGQPATQELQFGKKVVDTKLGSRAAMQAEPFFELGFDGPARESEGRVMLGTIGWTGNFSLTFEVDNVNNLRVIPAINPYASDYLLQPGTVFTTPEFIFTLSDNGTSQASRNLHDWARRYQLNDGMGDRLTLLNNWENTGFDFNQESLAALMREAKDLGVDMFLLDDGWFANKYPRKDDHAGLGDWEATRSKLPDGVPALVKSAKEAGVKFGIWIEPEMVNPKSELFEKHPDWAIRLPNRETYYYRNQLVLDMANPKVQDYVYSVVDNLMKENPELAYFKWDCNSPITNIYSPYLKDNQGNLYIDHVRGVYNVMRRVKENYPNLPIMLCSGGGARCDYESLKYFTEFWCSDDTDPYERLYIQWSMSKFFPAKAMAAHVTNWSKTTSVKFRTDVASMCKLGFDIGLQSMTAEELDFCRTAVDNFHRLKPVILDGEQYRLISPYETDHMAVNYVSTDKSKAVLFAYDLHPRFQGKTPAVRLQGLDAGRMYKVTEINLMPQDNTLAPGQPAKEVTSEDGKIYSGDYLMKVGLNVLTPKEGQSHVFELTAQ